MVLNLRLAAEDAHEALESEKKQVEGESPFPPFGLLVRLFGICSQFLFFVDGSPACEPPWGTQRLRPRLCRQPTVDS
jgi:hypothetical protein